MWVVVNREGEVAVVFAIGNSGGIVSRGDKEGSKEAKVIYVV